MPAKLKEDQEIMETPVMSVGNLKEKALALKIAGKSGAIMLIPFSEVKSLYSDSPNGNARVNTTQTDMPLASVVEALGWDVVVPK